jgi:hypothetical protein
MKLLVFDDETIIVYILSAELPSLILGGLFLVSPHDLYDLIVSSQHSLLYHPPYPIDPHDFVMLRLPYLPVLREIVQQQVQIVF